MDNTGLDNVHAQLIQQFVHEHPYRLSILIGQVDKGEYRVLYANMPAAHFLEGVWLSIQQQVSSLKAKILVNYIYFQRASLQENRLS